MKMTIDVGREAYDSLQKGKTISGSLVLTSDGVGNFRKYNRKPRTPDSQKQILPLKCGKAVATNEYYYAHVKIKRQGGVKYPAEIIGNDCANAADFFEEFRE